MAVLPCRRAFLGAAAAAAVASAAQNTRQNRRRPNIVLILADDLGYADLGAYGHRRNRTPHLDRLAATGLRFTDFHSNGPMCTATRAALLTGRYQNRLGRRFEGALGDDSYDTGLPLGTPTLASMLKQAGYATALFGKWHLGFQPPHMPTRFGFDEFRGIVHGESDHFSHVDRSGRPGWWHNETVAAESGYAADLLTRHAVRFIAENRRRPFFLYLAHLAIHLPWQAPGDAAYRQPGRDYNNLSKLGALTDKNVGDEVQAMVENLDANVGAITAALHSHGLTGDTLVFFTSDNGGYLNYEGGYHNISSNGPLRGQKTEVYEGGHRVPAIASWPGRIPSGQVTEKTAVSFDLLPTFAALAQADPAAAGLHPEGVNLAPLLLGSAPPPDRLASRSIFWRIGNRRAARRGDWKLVRNGNGPAELYNLAADIGERDNRAAAEPALARALEAELKAWEEEVDQSAAGVR